MAEYVLSEMATGKETASAVFAERLRTFRSSMDKAKRQSLEAEFVQLLEVVRSERNRRLVARLLGWDGGGSCTLQVAGDEIGLTRERVRQVCARALQTLHGRQFVPVLDSVLAYIRGHPNRAAADIEAELQSEGLTGGRFRLEGILKACEVFERASGFITENVGGELFVVTSVEVANVILKVARSMVCRWGALTISDLCSQISASKATKVEEEGVRRILQRHQDFRWLDEAGGWFWLAETPRNALATRLRKVLCVAPRISISELRAAISRDRRMQGVAPPRRVLLAYCEQLAWCHVDGQDVSVAQPLDPAEVLSQAERAVRDILRSHGEAMSVQALEALCLNAGISRPRFWQLALGSAVVCRYAPGIYGLVGAHLPPGLVERLAPRRRRTRVLQDFGWQSERQIWISFKLSEGMIRAGVFGVPSSLKRFLEGEYDLLTPDNSRIGRLSLKENSGWGLGPFFTRRGGEAGDYLVVVFDLRKREAIARVGGEELRDVYQGVISESLVIDGSSAQEEL
jgi:hypothetical protein